MDLTGQFPVNPHPTWNVHDASKLKEFMGCPRKYFFKYVLGWRREGANVHIEFGSAWHEAMAHLLEQDYSLDSVDEAHRKFTDHYRQFFPSEFDDEVAPKSPEYALTGLVGYINRYGGEDRDEEVLTLSNGKPAVEIAGKVLVSENEALYFRMDSILRDERGIFSREHKTGSRVTKAWLEGWLTDYQPSAYIHVLYCEYPPDEVYGVEINGFFPQKGQNKFERVDIRKTKKAMREWLWEVNYYLKQIEWNFHQLRESSSSDPVMRAFPKRTVNCTNFNRPCSFMGFCVSCDNPLKLDPEGQPGIDIRWWNPSDYGERNVLETEPK